MMEEKEMFCCEEFVQAVIKQDAERIRPFFAPDARIRWHCTNECFTVEEYILADCAYPGRWEGMIESIRRADDCTVIVTRVYSADRRASFHCVSFLQISGDRIVALDEYWADDGAPPDWRRAMKIGSPIRS